jgi:hypothetical protein
VSLDRATRESIVQIGELLETSLDFDGAAKAYTDALAIGPAPTSRSGWRPCARTAQRDCRRNSRDRSGVTGDARGPGGFGIRLAPLLPGGRRPDAALITDVRNNWAATWIMAVARAGVMEPYANHAFQPRTVVRRTDLAQAIARLLARVATENPSRAKGWESARLKFSDLSPSHIAYPAASVAVAAGVMPTGPDNTFQPSRPVTGAGGHRRDCEGRGLAGLR